MALAPLKMMCLKLNIQTHLARNSINNNGDLILSSGIIDPTEYRLDVFLKQHTPQMEPYGRSNGDQY